MLLKLLLSLAGLMPLVPVLFAQDNTQFPKDSEINLVISQAERAFDKYALDLQAQESLLPSLKNDKDQGVVEAWRTLVVGLKKQPQSFNGELGYLMVVTLDDASRNAALSSGQATVEATQQLLNATPENRSERVKAATNALTVGEMAQSDSLLLYSVSENANALYLRYVEANEALESQFASAMDTCKAALDGKKR